MQSTLGTTGGAVAETAAARGGEATVVIDALYGYQELVRGLGGDPETFLRCSGIDPESLQNHDAVIAFRRLVELLENTALGLPCADFGMRLGKAQMGAKLLGPIEPVMRNSQSVGSALRYLADHLHVYTTGAEMWVDEGHSDQQSVLRFQLLLDQVPDSRHTLEHALLVINNLTAEISDGTTRARTIWFSHEPTAPRRAYQRYFDCPVRFGQPFNGIFFADRDLQTPVINADPQLYDLAAFFVDSCFPATKTTVISKVRALVARLLFTGDCTIKSVASLLNLHERTLQRRLREEGHSFEGIKDDVRRDVALRYLRRSELPMMQIAELLGYSEASVFSRSCYRWFSVSPRQVRIAWKREQQ